MIHRVHPLGPIQQGSPRALGCEPTPRGLGGRFMNQQTTQQAPRMRRLVQAIAAAAALLGAAVASAEVEEQTLRVTPARLGHVEGDVAFWRPGAEEWEAATVNIPLAAGDTLASRDGRFEIQTGPQSFIRGADGTQLRVKSQEPDFLQLEVAQGSVVVDLRRLPVGHLVAIDSPQGAVNLDRDGFYRVDVDAETTRVTVRRAGVATLTPRDGQPLRVATGEAVSVSGGPSAQFAVVAAPAFDEWDRWNYARADSFLAAPSAAVVSSDVYGVAELDRHGSWREVATYGRVWAPYTVSAGWAPYTTGRWLLDPLYGWSWVDYQPWGWAPFHYGRWVYVGYWAWAPGPVLVRPVYAPALVAFFTPSVAISVGFGVPFVSWVALGWGEPLLPWWGGVGFYGVPCWYGWGGPRIINNTTIINYGDTVYGDQINLYRNTKNPGGLVGVPKDRFGGADVQRVRLAALSDRDVKPLRGGGLPASAATGHRPGNAPARPKGALPDLRQARQSAPQTARQSAATSFSRGPATGSSANPASPPKAASGRPTYDRLREQLRGTAPARQAAPKDGVPALGTSRAGRPAAKQALPAIGNSRTRAADAPPPLQGVAKPQGGSADAYRRMRDVGTRPASAPQYRRVESAPARVAEPAAAPANGGEGNKGSLPLAERAAPTMPKVRAMARNYDRAPSVNVAPSVSAPQPKAPSMPNLGGGGSIGGGSMGGGSPGGSMSRGGGGGGGGGRPNFSR
jgi:uncharacterized membrane protein YgcG